MPSAPNSSVPRVIVVGGGVAGLASAFVLRTLARKQGLDPRIIVLEKDCTAGGATRTDSVNGFLCEWGPNGFLDNEPATLELVKLLNLDSRLVQASKQANKRYIYHHGRMREVPLSPKAFLRSDILPVGAKLRMALEPVIRAKRNGYEESVYDFAKRRLGDDFARYMIDPMVSGIFAGNARELALGAVFPKMVEMETEYGSLVKAMIAKQRAAKRNGKLSGGPGGAAATLTTFVCGMGELTSKLAAELANELRMDAAVSTLRPVEQGFEVRANGETLSADAVVLACPAYAAAEILDECSTNAARALREIPYAPIDVVAHGHPVEDVGHPLDGFGVLIPRGEEFRVLGSLWCAAIFPNQVPPRHHLLRTMIGGAHDPQIVELSEAEVEEIATNEHKRLFQAKSDPVFARVIRHPRGIAQYTKGHLARVTELNLLEKQLPGLCFTGAGYRGVSVNGCVKDAFRVANELLTLWGVH